MSRCHRHTHRKGMLTFRATCTIDDVAKQLSRQNLKELFASEAGLIANIILYTNATSTTYVLGANIIKIQKNYPKIHPSLPLTLFLWQPQTYKQTISRDLTTYKWLGIHPQGPLNLLHSYRRFWLFHCSRTVSSLRIFSSASVRAGVFLFVLLFSSLAALI